MPRQVFLLGRHLGYSRSPAMHNAAFESLGLPYLYLSLSLEEADLPAALDAVRVLGAGANVTQPFKESILSLLDGLDPEAAVVGSVNTITVSSGSLTGHSTDGRGFLESCASRNIRLTGQRVLLLGSGGAGRAVAHAMAAVGIAGLTLANRTPERAGELASSLSVRFPSLPVEVCGIGRLTSRMLGGADLVVSALRHGVLPEKLLPLEGFHRGQVLVDLAYVPPVTPLMAAAARRGAAVHNGSSMLLHQGAASFTLWTGMIPPLEVMAAALDAGG